METHRADRSPAEAHRLHKIGLYWTGLCQVLIDKSLTLSGGRIQRTLFSEGTFVWMMKNKMVMFLALAIVPTPDL